jgi:hypothetical protein
MVTITLRCAHCEGQNIVRNCLAPNGKQHYLVTVEIRGGEISTP